MKINVRTSLGSVDLGSLSQAGGNQGRDSDNSSWRTQAAPMRIISFRLTNAVFIMVVGCKWSVSQHQDSFVFCFALGFWLVVWLGFCLLVCFRDRRASSLTLVKDDLEPTDFPASILHSLGIQAQTTTSTSRWGVNMLCVWWANGLSRVTASPRNAYL